MATDLFSAPLNLRKSHCLPYISKSLNTLTRLSRMSANVVVEIFDTLSSEGNSVNRCSGLKLTFMPIARVP